MKCVMIIGLVCLGLFTNASAAPSQLGGYVGTWNLVKGEKHSCPNSVMMKSSGSTKIEMSEVRGEIISKIQFEDGKVLEAKAEVAYTKAKKPDLDKDFTVKSSSSALISNNRLVSSYLWVVPEKPNDGATGLKVTSLPDPKTLVQEKILTGYGQPDKDKEGKRYTAETDFAKYSDGSALTSATYRCEYKKQ